MPTAWDPWPGKRKARRVMGSSHPVGAVQEFFQDLDIGLAPEVLDPGRRLAFDFFVLKKIFEPVQHLEDRTRLRSAVPLLDDIGFLVIAFDLPERYDRAPAQPHE